MSSKYLSRPDIDAIWKSQGNQDVYETPDLDAASAVSEVVYEVQDKENECIDRASLDKTGSFEAFKDKRYVGGGGLGDGWGYEASNARGRRFESPLQRYHRLRSELDELSTELESVKEDPAVAKVVPSALAAEVGSLQQKMIRLLDTQTARAIIEPDFAALLKENKQADLTAALLSAVQQVQAAPGAGKDGAPVTYELVCAAPSGADGRDAKLALMESKLAGLERYVGGAAVAGGGNERAPGAATLSASVAKLEGAFGLMDASGVQMEVLKKKLEALSAQLASTKQKEPAGADADAKVNEMYSAVLRWDKVAQQLPVVVERLHALKDLHMHSASISTAVANVEEQQHQLTKRLKENAQLLAKMEAAFAENVKTVHDNIATLEKKMKK